jgi:hypothetical protein
MRCGAESWRTRQWVSWRAAPDLRAPVQAGTDRQRNGALALLAALDVHTGKVFAATPGTTGIKPFMTLMGQVMNQPPE